MIRNILHKLRDLVRIRRSKFFGKSAGDVFKQIYTENHWKNPESVSGPGSTLETTQAIRKALPDLMKKYEISSLLDIPCGDFHWMNAVDLGEVIYTGGDIVEELILRNQQQFGREGIHFQKLDLVSDPIPANDLLICRDGLVHLDHQLIRKAMRNIAQSGCKYFLCTHFPDVEYNKQIHTGDWRPLNLTLPPFSFPEPVEYIDEGVPENEFGRKWLALWEINANFLNSNQFP